MKHIETPTGTYELRHVVSDLWVVCSPRNDCPVATYKTEQEAVDSLDSIHVDDDLPKKPLFLKTLQEVVLVAMSYDSFRSTPANLPLLDRLLHAAAAAEDCEESTTLIELAIDCRLHETAERRQ